MKKPDTKVVQNSIQKSYFPSETGQFNLKQLKARQAAGKKLERKYKERVKSATSIKKAETKYATSNANLKPLAVDHSPPRDRHF